MNISGHPTCCKFQQFRILDTDTVKTVEKTLVLALERMERIGYIACLQGLVPASNESVISLLEEKGFYSSPKPITMGDNNKYYFMFYDFGEKK